MNQTFNANEICLTRFTSVFKLNLSFKYTQMIAQMSQNTHVSSVICNEWSSFFLNFLPSPPLLPPKSSQSRKRHDVAGGKWIFLTILYNRLSHKGFNGCVWVGPADIRYVYSDAETSRLNRRTRKSLDLTLICCKQKCYIAVRRWNTLYIPSCKLLGDERVEELVVFNLLICWKLLKF